MTSKDKKEKQSSGGPTGSSSSGGSSSNSKSNSNNANNSANTTSNNPPSSSPSSLKSANSSKSTSSSSTSKIKEEIIEQSSSEQVICTRTVHEDGSPPTNIIKKEPTASSSSSGSGASGSGNVNSNDSNNNNDTNDNKNSNSSGNPLMPEDKDSANDNSITDELLNSEELGAPGSNSNSNKLGMQHIKSEDPATDPLAGVDSSLSNNNFGSINPSNNPSGPNRSLMPQNSPDRIQPLPSNVVNKQSNSMDYMQQQSQIFVFSTTLANKGAEAVRSGQFPTIIAYHCAQPETKKFLQKFPLKVNQFNRSGWFPNMATNMNNSKKPRMMPLNQQNFNFMKNNPMNAQQPGGGGPMNNQMGMPGGFPQSCDMNNPEGNMMWQGNQQQQQMNMDPLGNNGPSSLDPLLNDPIDSLVNDPLGPSPQSNQMNNSHQSPMGGNMLMDPTSPNIPSLQGVKVPDEDLTPQQRHQRALKLAQLQELKQMFKQEPQSLNPNECQMNEQDTTGGPGSCAKMNQMGPNPMNPMNPMMQGGMMQGGNQSMNPMNPMNPGMNGPMRPNFPMGMGPRGNMMRPMGPGGMNPNSMNDEMMPGMGSPMGGPCGGPMNQGNMQMGPGGGMMGNMNLPPHMQGGNSMGMNNMGPGMNNMNNMNNMGPGGPNMGMMQKGMPPNMMGGPPGPANMQAHMEWNKLQQQYYDESKRKGLPMGGPMDMNCDPSMGPMGPMGPMGRQMPPGAMRNMPNMRGPGPGQGPPPPYHQTPRSASVPIATQSPNPNSPNNPTSNLSLPSPRGGCNSTLNSPAAGDPTRSMNPQHMNMKHMNPRQSPTTSQDSPAGVIGRQINHSNPSTPISSHLSPNASLKDLEMSTNPNKEPNLMPVPSPQQISYLNTFESQELTIQKQPNTNIKDGCSNMGVPNQGNMNLDNRLPGQKTPTSASNPHMANFPSPLTPGGSSMPGDKNRINQSGPSPQNNLQRSNSMMGNDMSQFPPHQHPNNQQQSNESNMQFPSDTPNMPFGPNAQQQQQQNNKMSNFMEQKPGDMGNNGPPPQFAPCSGRPDLPLNPNSNATMTNTKPSPFDPISSLAQMSQQLSSTGVPGPMNGQPMMGGFNNNGMMNDMGPMGMVPDGQMGPGGQMDFGGMGPGMGPNQFGPRSMSPKIGGPQMGFPGPGPMGNMRMGRPMGYNGTNIQVKPNAPNTIQYLPARPQMNNSNPPRGPPSLDFLQRFTNPMGMDDMNKGGPGGNQQNMPYFPNQNNPAACMGSEMGPLDGSGNPMGPGNGPPVGMMNQNPMMMRGMRGNGGGNMMRFPGPPSGGPGNPCMMGNNSFNNSNNPNMGGDHQMMFGGPGGQQNPQMFVAGPKGSPMGSPMGGPPNPEQMQQMMGGPGGPPPHFKQQQQQQQQSHFPSTADPNYAQQYHNFQQQLYATNNNNQRNQMGMGGNQVFMPK